MADDDIEGLAAEYALGSLTPAERRYVDALSKKDALLADAINAWQRRLEPLSVLGPEVAPPSYLLDRIVAQISASPRPIARFPMTGGRLRGMRRTRLVIGASALAACIALVAMYILMRTPAIEVAKPQLEGTRSMRQQIKMDCSTLYKDFWQKFDRETFATISASRLAGTSRMALRAYDACVAGDEQDAKAIFERLSKVKF
jgi:anti-sigma-K factor RskA